MRGEMEEMLSIIWRRRGAEVVLWKRFSHTMMHWEVVSWWVCWWVSICMKREKRRAYCFFPVNNIMT